tara:strand:- start:171 stop:656 length:486 start_codon:yes stop_codon:yes gene_type:complete
MNDVRQALEALDLGDVGARVEAGESVNLAVGGETVTLEPEDLVVERVPAEGLAVVSDFGCTVAVDTTMTRDLLLEGLMRDFVRQVQNLRKDADLNVTDRIKVYTETDGDLADAIEVHADYIKAETLAVDIHIGASSEAVTTADIKISGSAARIGVTRVQAE